ncbi:MAG: AlpA family transcriptional regulator [Burkholderiales bacterium]|nr:AlpA family transcriptional regulator [Burkholderiales bacterium]
MVKHKEPGAPAKILRRPVVVERTGLSGTSIWREMQAGRFPRPVALGRRAVGWLSSEIDEWIADRAAARDE